MRENIADNGGIKMMSQSWKKHIASDPNDNKYAFSPTSPSFFVFQIRAETSNKRWSDQSFFLPFLPFLLCSASHIVHLLKQLQELSITWLEKYAREQVFFPLIDKSIA